MRRAFAGALALVCLTGCFAGSSNLTDTGKGRPLVEVDFPASAAAGSIQTVTLTITNPGPGDMTSLLVTFTLVGAPSAGGSARPIVGVGARGANPSITEIDPEPLAVSDDGVVYQFEGLDVDESTAIEFSVRMPDDLGPAANAITVSDSQELDRARGVRIETTITG
jgi:hypothetical protein